MALNFPNSPSLNDTHTHNGLTWVWNGSVWEMQGSGGASVTVSDNAPSSPTHGDMWWESDTGDLKIYYDESETGAGSGAFWVSANGADSMVGISTTAPTNPQTGDLWWDSDVAALYMYYNDGNSSQWVSAASGATGAQGAAGAQGATGPVAGSSSQVVYKDGSNNPAGSSSFTFDGTNLTVGGNLNVGGNVDFDSSKIVFDSGGNVLKWADNVAAYFGTGNDLRIYHDASNSYINDQGTGSLIVRASRFRVNNAANTENIIRADQDGAVYLYYDNSQKLITKSDGIDVTGELQCDTLDVDGSADISGNLTLHGNLDMQDSDQIKMGSGDDFLINHDGTNTYVSNYTGQLIFRTDSNEVSAAFVPNGPVKLYHDNSNKFETTSNGININGFMKCDNPGVYLDALDWSTSNNYMHSGHQFWQVGNNWNNSTGTFTCPVAGKYFVAADAQAHHAPKSGTTYANLIPYKNNASYGLESVATVASGGTGHHAVISFAIIMDCAANDTIRVYSNHSFRNNTQNHLTIYLLG